MPVSLKKISNTLACIIRVTPVINDTHSVSISRSVTTVPSDLEKDELFFNDIPEEESQKLREAFYSPSGNVRLSEMEESLINEMENSELLTMDAFFESVNFGELELIASFDQKPLFTFLRF